MEKNQDTHLQKTYQNQTETDSPIHAGVLGFCAALVLGLGVLPHVGMDRMAELAQDFFLVKRGSYHVHYFIWENLKGSLISVVIGLTLYVLVVRGWMIKKQPDGTVGYVERWPNWLDIEELVYRPIFLKLLPGALGWTCWVLDRLPDLIVRAGLKTGAFLVGVMDISVDAVVVLLRKTVYRDSPKQQELEEGNALTHTIGVVLNGLEQLLNRSIWKNHVHKKDLEHWFVLKYASFKENVTVIGRSLSYGLVSFCIGLCATLLYLLVSAFQ